MSKLEEEFVQAASEGNITKMLTCLSSGVDVNARVRSGVGGTALYQAVSNNQIEAVKLLLQQADLDVNCVDTNESGWSALHVAAIKGFEEITALLLKHSQIDLNIKTRNGKTPLIYAVTGKRERVVQFLISDKRLEINESDDDGFDALMYASKENNVQIAKLLLRHPKLEFRVNNAQTAYSIAKDRKFREMEQVLKGFSGPELKTEVGKILNAHDLTRFATGFFEQGIKTLDVARKLNENDLKYMNVDSVGDRKAILKALGCISTDDDIPEAIPVASATTIKAKVDEATAVIIDTLPEVNQETRSLSTGQLIDDLPTAPSKAVEVSHKKAVTE